MEYLRGLSLADLVDRHGPLPPGRVIYLLRQACEALAEAHAAGLIHRDLKPANLFAARRGGRHDVVKLLDFGLVKSLDGDPTATPGSAGRIQRHAAVHGPRAGPGAPGLDHRCDLYALGGVAYFLLTGHAFFEVGDVNGMSRPRSGTRWSRPPGTGPSSPTTWSESCCDSWPRTPPTATPTPPASPSPWSPVPTPAHGTTRRRPAGGVILRQKWPIPPAS